MNVSQVFHKTSRIMLLASCLVLVADEGLTETVVQLTSEASPAAAIADVKPAVAIAQELAVDPAFAVTADIDASVDDGYVILAGAVDSLYEKQRAGTIAQRQSGVKMVINKIDVRDSVRKDRSIRDDIINRLQQQPAVDAHEINVRVENGVVLLSGLVDSWAAWQLPAQLAAQMRGVKRVANRVRVYPAQARPDTAMQLEVQDRISNDVWVPGSLIRVRVRDGVVRLEGVVDSLADKAQAIGDAWVTGVKDVDASQLDVRTVLSQQHSTDPDQGG